MTSVQGIQNDNCNLLLDTCSVESSVTQQDIRSLMDPEIVPDPYPAKNKTADK